MPQLGTPELLIILVIILLLFGIGRLGRIGGELGSGIRAFRDGLKDPEKDKAEKTVAGDSEDAGAVPTDDSEKK
jgi:sec-independent protein translocase protein TatA